MVGTNDTTMLAGGRKVTMLPRAGGPAWAGVVQAWEASRARVVARVAAAQDAVDALDQHQVWLSTVVRVGDQHGITIFAGSALAVDPEALRLEGIVRLASEPRRQAVRAPGSTVTLPALADGRRSVPALDLSRGGVRLHVGPGDWPYGDTVALVVHLDGDASVHAVGRLIRLEESTHTAVLRFVDLADEQASAIDRFVLAQLPQPA